MNTTNNGEQRCSIDGLGTCFYLPCPESPVTLYETNPAASQYLVGSDLDGHPCCSLCFDYTINEVMKQLKKDREKRKRRRARDLFSVGPTKWTFQTPPFFGLGSICPALRYKKQTNGTRSLNSASITLL